MFCFPDISNIQENDENSVFQYYTIVNNPNTFLPIIQDDNSENGVLLLTFGQEDEPDEVKKEEEQENVQEDTEEASSSSFLSNLKLITLEDGRMFVTASDSDERKLLCNFLSVLYLLVRICAAADLSSIQELLVKNEETTEVPVLDQEVSNAGQYLK